MIRAGRYDLWRGRRVRLAAADPAGDAAALARWWADSEFLRHFDTTPARPISLDGGRSSLEERITGETSILFAVRVAADDRLIGFVELEGFEWPHGLAWLTAAIGDRRFWGGGFGSEAVLLIVRYGFRELNLSRIALTVFEYNTRALRAYARCGFVVEGRAREFILRDGRRWDLIYMGLLREEWLRQPEVADA